MSSIPSRSALLPAGAVCCAAMALFWSRQRAGLTSSDNDRAAAALVTTTPSHPTAPQVDRTLAGYEAARQQLEAGRAARAVAQLERLRNQPLAIAPAHVARGRCDRPSVVAECGPDAHQ